MVPCPALSGNAYPHPARLRRAAVLEMRSREHGGIHNVFPAFNPQHGDRHRDTAQDRQIVDHDQDRSSQRSE
jgi:hypothetical protein